MDWSNKFHRCRDCDAVPGTYHSWGCDTEYCAACRHQALSCGCSKPADDKRLPWTGVWPGQLEAAELGLWSWFGPGGWTVCAADHPEASPALNEWAVRGSLDTPVALRLITKAKVIAQDTGMKGDDRETILKGVFTEILRELRL